MKIVLMSSIAISPTRQRRLFDPAKLHEFADGIQQQGLFHPIILREVAGVLTLVAGERRLRAVTDIAGLGGSIKHDGQEVPLGHIPYTLLSDLDELAAEEAELSENIHREDLTWQERVAALSRLQSLRTTQATTRGDPAPSIADLSLEVRGTSEGIHHENTRRELIVARHLDDPEVAAVKTVDEAFKLLRRKESAAKDRALGAAVGKTFTADLHVAVNGNCLEWLANCQDEQFDVILTDPPYGMGADEFGNSGGLAAGAHGYVDSPDITRQLIAKCADPHLYRIAKPQAHLYLFCDIDQFHFLRDLFEATGWWVFRTPLLWYKRTAMRAPWPEHGPQRKYECILYAVKGKKPVLKMAPDVLDFPPDSNLGHMAQKPVALFKELLSRSVRPGDVVLDPFMGSGPIFPAAHEMKCKAVGIELDQGSYGIAVKRIEALKS